MTITIENVTIQLGEINRKENNLGGIREKVVGANEEYSLGKNRNLYQINIRNRSPLFRYKVDLFLSKDKMLLLNNLFIQQQSDRLYSYTVGNDIKTDILYTYSNTSSLKDYCFIEDFKINDTSILDSRLIYKCNIVIVEI